MSAVSSPFDQLNQSSLQLVHNPDSVPTYYRLFVNRRQEGGWGVRNVLTAQPTATVPLTVQHTAYSTVPLTAYSNGTAYNNP